MEIREKGLSVGREGLIHVDELKISVIVRDVRIRWLIVDYPEIFSWTRKKSTVLLNSCWENQLKRRARRC